MGSGVKVKVLKRKFVQSYIIHFIKAYNDIVDGESHTVVVPVASLDFEMLNKGDKTNIFCVIIEVQEVVKGIDVFDILNNRNLNRFGECEDYIKSLPNMTLEDLVVVQDKADNLDGFMWGVCVSTADRLRKKERQAIKNSKSFINEVIGFIKGAGIVVC